MIQNDNNSNNNTALENIAEISIANIMKNGWCQTVNNLMLYYKTPFDIALILEQVSNYNSILIKKVNMEKAARRIQNNIFREENSIRPRINATSKEHKQNGLDDRNVNN